MVHDATRFTFHMFHWYSYVYTDVPRPSRLTCEGLACKNRAVWQPCTIILYYILYL